MGTMEFSDQQQAGYPKVTMIGSVELHHHKSVSSAESNAKQLTELPLQIRPFRTLSDSLTPTLGSDPKDPDWCMAFILT
jgi:hypothetical protein